MDLVVLELQRSSAREVELAGSSPAALTARAAAVAVGHAPPLDDRCEGTRAAAPWTHHW